MPPAAIIPERVNEKTVIAVRMTSGSVGSAVIGSLASGPSTILSAIPGANMKTMNAKYNLRYRNQSGVARKALQFQVGTNDGSSKNGESFLLYGSSHLGPMNARMRSSRREPLSFSLWTQAGTSGCGNGFCSPAEAGGVD